MWHEKRKKQRRPLDCLLEVEGEIQQGQIFQERAVLVNLSEGGAQFTSLYQERYHVGQTLQTSIFLPGTPEGGGLMKTMAQVMRVDEAGDNSPQNGAAQANVAIYFPEPFHLMR